MVRRGDACRVLVDVEVAVKVGVELRPGRADALAVAVVHLHLRSVDLEHQLGHQVVQVVGGQGAAALDLLVDLELEARERRHDEEVAVEVRHRLFDHRELKGGVGRRGQQVAAREGLVHVRRDLGLEQPVVRVDIGLRAPRVVRVHGVAELVSQGAHRVDVVVVAHEDERPRVHCAGREGAHALALVGVDVDPTVFGGAFAHHPHVLLPQRRDAFGDPVDSLLVRDPEHLGAQLGAGVVGPEDLHAERLSPDPPVAVPRADVVAERAHDVVEDLDRDVARLERCLQR